jgi:lipopolysaccharide/colanic/teichoic acid biosynthesis glycosyltransferase
MLKRSFDIIFSMIGLIVFLPILLFSLFIVWLQDFKSPFYIAHRVGYKHSVFKMIKIRTMVVNADKSGVSTTSTEDNRITSVGRIIRKIKIDELIALVNVIKGDMSLVGPRPQIEKDVNDYTEIENQLLDVRPGITDFSSIVFSDEAEVVSGSKDPDLCYNQLIRPWKSRLGILYVKNISLMLDFKLILLTLVVVYSRKTALFFLNKLLEKLTTDEQLIHVASRKINLFPYPPPGSHNIVTSRN